MTGPGAVLVVRELLCLILALMFVMDYWAATQKDQQIAQLRSRLTPAVSATDGAVARAEQEATQRTIEAGNRATAGIYYIHKPPDGCPPGWAEQPGLFREKDGSVRDGCEVVRSPDGSVHGDYLEPGESVGIPIQMPVPAEPKGGKV